ncbi:unnamed protein product [Vicia faba]|uniref:Peroxisomal ATPase PEX1 N-terminal C-lobe domain-containing protein n=1 Tax=Vicia faba TaxID=3906 RepID=A0AAV1AMV3_VICFA|nr:unnamed protein product [Vicia faba]
MLGDDIGGVTMLLSLTTATPGHYASGFKILNQLISEMNQLAFLSLKKNLMIGHSLSLPVLPFAEPTLILNQVRIVHEGMKLPLRLNGHTVITFHVASVFPKNAYNSWQEQKLMLLRKHAKEIPIHREIHM